MALGVLVGAAVGAGTIYVWGWRRYKYLRAHFRNERQKATFERALHDARELAAGDPPYRAATDDDRELTAGLGASDVDALIALGFTALGDLAVQRPGRPVDWIMRAFVDRAATTCAFLAVGRPDPVQLAFCSYAAGEVFTTVRGTSPRLADPPFTHRKATAKELPLATIIAEHRASAKLDDAARIASRDMLLAELARSHVRVRNWRAAQPPDELLDADLKNVLGEHYARLGKVWARRMRAELPQATVRRG